MKNNGPFAALAKAQFLAAGPMLPQIEEPAESDADG
jgi:hypothetical protein